MPTTQEAEKRIMNKSKANQTAIPKQGASKRTAPDPIDLMELFFYMLPRSWMICLAGLLGALLAGLYTLVCITPTYESSATIYISDMTTVSIQNLELGSSMTVDYTIMANTENVATDAMKSLGIEDKMDWQTFLDMVSVSNPEDSHMLQITATNSDPVMATDIANAMAEAMQEKIATTMDTKKPATVQKALVPSSPSAPSIKRNMAKGFILFAGIVCAIFFFLFTFKDTISTEKDVEKYLGLTVISSIGKGNRNSIYISSIPAFQSSNSTSTPKTKRRRNSESKN